MCRAAEPDAAPRWRFFEGHSCLVRAYRANARPSCKAVILNLSPLSNPHSDITDLGVLRKMLMGSLAFLLYWI